MEAPAATCAACGVTRPLKAFLLVTMRATNATFYVCRPSGERGDRLCFARIVPSADRASIALAVAR